VIAFLRDDFNEAKLTDLIWGLATLDWSATEPTMPERCELPVPYEFGVPRLLVHPAVLYEQRGRWLYAQTTELAEANAKPDPDVFHILASGQAIAVPQCVDRAARRLKSGGRLVCGYRNRQLTGRPLGIESPISADRLLAAMLFPLSSRDLETIANTVLYPPEVEE
jgi:CRISPR-associated protein Csx17